MQTDTKLVVARHSVEEEIINISILRSLVLSCRKVRNYSKINRIKIGLFSFSYNIFSFFLYLGSDFDIHQ